MIFNIKPGWMHQGKSDDKKAFKMNNVMGSVGVSTDPDSLLVESNLPFYYTFSKRK